MAAGIALNMSTVSAFRLSWCSKTTHPMAPSFLVTMMPLMLSIHLEDDLPEHRTTLEHAVRLRGVPERHHPVDHRTESSGPHVLEDAKERTLRPHGRAEDLDLT